MWDTSNSWGYFINLGVSIFIILLFIFSFPVIVRQLAKGVWALTTELQASQFKENLEMMAVKFPGAAASQCPQHSDDLG